MKRLAIFLDGTWNDKVDKTNVFRLSQLVADRSADQAEQKCHYDTGVGTVWGTKMIGGMFGVGLSKNIREAYDFLREKYVDGDQVFIFGFSRGAYTARALCGLIATCGLVRAGKDMTTEEIYDRYERRREGATPIYTIERIVNGWDAKRELTPDEKRLWDCSRRIDIEMVAVWDTVGALGVPWKVPFIGPRSFWFLNTRPTTICKHSFQAMAIDEHRAAYESTLWTAYTQTDASGQPVGKARSYPLGTFEQRWFIGAHSDVGGGYKDKSLAQIPMRWIQEKAAALGLTFTNKVTVDADAHLRAKPVDSFLRFGYLLYAAIKLGQRFYRTIGAALRPVDGGISSTINEWIDATVFDRYQQDSGYRPKNLERWAQARDKHLMSLTGDQAA